MEPKIDKLDKNALMELILKVMQENAELRAKMQKLRRGINHYRHFCDYWKERLRESINSSREGV